MNAKALVTMLLLLLCTMIFASEDAGDTADHELKTQELNQLAERFKAETGFNGDISFNHNDMKISQIKGSFRSIQMKATQDTALAMGVIDQVQQIVTPFISAREGQLFPKGVYNNEYTISRKWEQKVNGYKVHPGGYLYIAYNIPTDEFVVTDATADISNDPVPMNISQEEAKQILINEYRKSEFNDEQRGFSHDPSIGYFKIPTSKHPSQFRLYWTMMFWRVSFSIDVESLEIAQTMTTLVF